jgi:hypothetical protein
MIIHQKVGSYDTVGAPVQSTEMTIDQQGLEFIFKAFSDTLYSDKIGSIVREITSNCFDSHAEAGSDKPVMIRPKAPSYGDSNSGNIVFEDFGVGISPDRMQNIFRKYFSSTKRGTNNEIGGFGIGSKTPLSYVNTFTIITRYNGEEYTYLIHRGDKTPMVDLISKEETNESNGTQVHITIQSRTDYNRFEEAIKRQLKFFDNVVIDHPDFKNFNSERIYRGKHFIFRENDDNRYSGICLGKVFYPLNFDLVNLSKYDFHTPICLLFDIGEIEVTLNREAIDYNDRVISAIKNKVKEAQKELSELYKTQNNVLTDLKEFLKARRAKTILRVGDMTVLAKGFIEASNSDFVYAPFKGTPIIVPDYPFREYYISCKIHSNGKVAKKMQISDLNIIEKGYKIFRLSDKLSKRKTLYINSIHPEYYVLKKSEIAAYELDDLLRLRSYSDSEREKYRALYRKEILKFIVSITESYDKTVVDPDWLKNYLTGIKPKNTLKTISDSIIIHVPNDPGFFKQITCSPKNIDNYLSKKGRLFIYGGSDDESKLRRMADILRSINYISPSGYYSVEYKKCPFILAKLSAKNIVMFKDIPGFIHVDEFVEKYPKVILRSHYTNLLSSIEVSSLQKRWGYFREFFNEEFKNKVNTIKNKAHYNVVHEKYQYVIENNPDLHVFQDGISLKDLSEEILKWKEYYSILDAVSHVNIGDMENKHTIIRHLLKLNLKTYYHAQKNLCSAQ